VPTEDVDELLRVLDREGRDDISDDWMQAARRLGELKEQRAVEPLLRCLNVAGTAFFASSKRVHAIWALCSIGDPSAVGPICEVLDDVGSDNMLLNDIFGGLCKFGPSAIEPLCRQLAKGRTFTSRWAAAQALGEIGGKEVLPVLKARLRPLIGERNDTVRRAIQNSVERIERRLAGLPPRIY